MKAKKLAKQASFHGKAKGWTFEGPHQDGFGGKNLWVAGASTGDGGNQFAKSLPDPPKSKSKIKQK